MKKVLSLLIAVFMIATIIPLTFISVNAEVWDGTTIATAFESGDGSQGNPYVIATPAQLAYLSQSVNAGTTYAGQYLVVSTDIDLGDKEWDPIGFYDYITEGKIDVPTPFMGTFDGQGHTIGNMVITGYKNGTSLKRGGLFGLADSATIKNFTVENFVYNIELPLSGANIGGVIGEATNCAISNLVVEDTVVMNIITVTKGYMIGGIAGRITDSNVSYCINKSNSGDGSIVSDGTNANLGGIIGCTAGLSFINNCINYGAFKANLTFLGGIVGLANAGGYDPQMTTLENCVNYGNLISDTSTRYVNGIISGASHDIGDYTIRNSYNAGTLTGGKLNYDSGVIGTIRKAGSKFYLTNVGCIQEKAMKFCSVDTTYNGTVYPKANSADFLAAINADCGNTPIETIDAHRDEILANIEVSKIADLATNPTASIRMTEGSTGMRFTTTVNSNATSELATAGYSVVKVGTMILPSSYIVDARGNSKDMLNALNRNENEGTYTNFLDVESAINSGDSFFLGSIANIKTDNYTRDFTAIGYITVKDNLTDVETTVYSATSSERNVAQIATAAVNDIAYIDSANMAYVFDKTVSDASEPPVSFDIYKVDSTNNYTSYSTQIGSEVINIDENDLGVTVNVGIFSSYTEGELIIINSFIPVS